MGAPPCTRRPSRLGRELELAVLRRVRSPERPSRPRRAPAGPAADVDEIAGAEGRRRGEVPWLRTVDALGAAGGSSGQL